MSGCGASSSYEQLYLHQKWDVSDLPLPVRHKDIGVIIVHSGMAEFLYDTRKVHRNVFKQYMRFLRDCCRRGTKHVCTRPSTVHVQNNVFHEMTLVTPDDDVCGMLLFRSKAIRDANCAWLTKRV